jgi:hypothetical protein
MMLMIHTDCSWNLYEITSHVSLGYTLSLVMLALLETLQLEPSVKVPEISGC